MSSREARDLVVVHYDEVGTKGKNRSLFAGVLRRNIRRALAGLPPSAVRSRHARVFIELEGEPDAAVRQEVARRLRTVMGIAHFAFARRIPGRPLDRLERECLEIFAEALAARPQARSFAVRTHRGDKTFPLASPEINRRLGARLQEAFGLAVDIRSPDLLLHVEILPDSILVYARREEASRGLPVGVSARVMSLLSSGIDSPVASWRMMGRGCRVFYAHFHSMPYTRRASVDLAVDLVRTLAPYQPRSDLFLVPLGEIQREIALVAPPALRVVLYRRWMMRMAGRLALKVRARALVTGDSIGQVASQTVENLAVVEAASPLPVLRPLLAMRKEEIIATARALGTYALSTEPYDDCCAYLTPARAETRARLAEVAALEERIGDLEERIRDALARTEHRVFACAEGALRPL